MIYTSENNWYTWSYGKNIFGRQTGGQEFKTQFSKCRRPVKHFSEELKNAVRSVLDCYTDLKPQVFFSGGVDSELLVRSFLAIGYTPEIFIVRYENDYNIADVSYAVTICTSLGIDYKIVDFNLNKFYNNEADSISEISQIDRPRALPQCKFLNIGDGLPILGASDITAYRTNDNYSTKGEWMIRCWEHDIGWSKYAREINRPAIPEWFKWTPELVYSFSKLEWFKKLTSDQYPGKLGINSTKILGYREVYPDLISRKKLTGFEKIEQLILEVEQHLNKKYNGLPFRHFVDRTLNSFESELEFKNQQTQ
jgi:hypothetical protein